MCGGVCYHSEQKFVKVFFPNPNAKLPILKKGGTVEFVPWGRRKQQAGNLPLGGWARLESIQVGRWAKYFPKPVKIHVHSFMEKDIEGNSHWFELTKGQWIQGLLAYYDQEFRIYIVTVTPEQENAVYHRWPRILSSPELG